GRDMGPVDGVGRVHLRERAPIRVQRRIVRQARIVIDVIEFAVVHRRRPQRPVFVFLARLRRLGGRGAGRVRVALQAGERPRIDASGAGGPAQREGTAGARSAGAEGRVVSDEGNTILLKNVAGRDVLAAAERGDVDVL